jgi:phosphate:Na+ symporter
MCVAALLQSATAVALLAAGFAASGTLSLATGLSLMLGADLGSAIVARTLSVPIDWLVPALIVIGGGLFFRGPSRAIRQTGRILMGVALILVSLRMLGEATAPLRHLEALPQIVAHLAGDPLTAFLIAAGFTWLIHSSVAAILLFAAFAAQGLVPVELGACLVLGANLGGALIAVGLTREGAIEGRRIALGNLVFRGIGAALVLVLVRVMPAPVLWLGPDAAQQMIHLHLAFNLVLLVVCLPFTGPMAALMERLVRPAPGASPLAPPPSCLDASVVDQPRLALASAKRELVRMAEIVERMLAPVMELYETGDPARIAEVRKLELAVNRAQSEIKLYLSRIAYADDMMEEARRGRDLAGLWATPSPRRCSSWPRPVATRG